MPIGIVFITFDGTCKNLHSHNFHVELEVRGQNTGDAFVIGFVLLNRLAARICRELHDGVLLPGESAIALPVSNTTAEMLASHIGNRMEGELAAPCY